MTSHAAPNTTTSRETKQLLVLDVDGVTSPVKGDTAWGDDVIAGWAFGPVPVSPILCARLDRLAQIPGMNCRWLTSWTPQMRQHLDPFLGREWPDIPQVPEVDEWWKWTALDAWLREHPEITHLVWCDDDLATPMFDHQDDYDLEEGAPTRLVVYRQWLAERGIDALLIAPLTSIGLTPDHLSQIEAAITR